jgi:hypothetical protein
VYHRKNQSSIAGTQHGAPSAYEKAQEKVAAAALGIDSHKAQQARQQKMLRDAGWDTSHGADLSDPETIASCLRSDILDYRLSKALLHGALLKFLNLLHQEVQVVDSIDDDEKEGISMTAAKAFVEQSTSFGEVIIHWDRPSRKVSIFHYYNEIFEKGCGFDDLIDMVKYNFRPDDFTLKADAVASQTW